MILCCPSEKEDWVWVLTLPCEPGTILSLLRIFLCYAERGEDKLWIECSPSDVSRVIYPFLCLKALSVDISVWWVFHSVFLSPGSPPLLVSFALIAAFRDLRSRIRTQFLVSFNVLFSFFSFSASCRQSSITKRAFLVWTDIWKFRTL